MEESVCLKRNLKEIEELSNKFEPTLTSTTKQIVVIDGFFVES